MARTSTWIVALLVVAILAPPALADDEAAPVALRAQHLLHYPLNASDETRTLWVFWNASMPVDVAVLTSQDYLEYLDGAVPAANATFLETNASSGMRHVALAPDQAYVLVWDNTDWPEGGAAGTHDLTIDFNGFATNASRSSLASFVRTATLQQHSWLVPDVPGVGVAGPALVFFAIAAGCEVVAWRENKRRWIDVGIMVGLGALFSTFVASKGVILPDTRLLTVPAILIGAFGLKRHRTVFGAAAGVFAACFWGPLIGGDLLSLALHHAEIERGWYIHGAAMIVGGAGWKDALVIVPVVGLLGFVFRRFTLLGWIMGWRKARKRSAAPSAPTAPAPPGRLSARGEREGATIRLVVTCPRESGIETLTVDVLDAASGLRVWGDRIDVGLAPGAERSLDLQLPEEVAARKALRVAVRSARDSVELHLPSPS